MTSHTEDFAAIGLKVKTGRAFAVILVGASKLPQLQQRRELTLTDPQVTETFQPPQEVMELPWSESEKKVRPFVRAIEKVAASALAELIHELRAQGFKTAGVGICGSADRDLSRIGNFHIRAHAAEGRLFRRVLEFAATSNNVVCRTFVEKTLLADAAAEIGCTIAQFNKYLKMIVQPAGPPWRTDQRLACAAAWVTLTSSTQF